MSVTLATGVVAGGLTVTRQEASWFPSTVRTLIVVVPAASAFTVIEGPEVLLIEAFPGSLVDQITALFVAVAGRTVAFSVKLFPISKVLLDSLSVTLATGVVVARGVILNEYLVSPPGFPSASALLVPSSILSVKLVLPLACKVARDTDAVPRGTFDNSTPSPYHIMSVIFPLGIVTTSFLLDSVITILLGTSAPLN